MDDQKGVLDRVSGMLAREFDVVGCETDARRALETARQVDPDAIVLDINMPGFNGFEALRALQRAGARAAVVFLSLLGDEEHVAEAFRLGARGYVLKAHVMSDLGAALDLALSGRRFAPSLTTWLEVAGDGGHAMHIHRNEQSFVDALVALLHRALRRGDATCLIAPGQVREAVGAGLRAHGWDVGGAQERFRAHDAAAALEGVMRDGTPDAHRLAELVGELDRYRLQTGDGTKPLLTIGGTLSAMLAAGGNVEGAIRLERLWNELTAGLPFVTVCGYSTSCFHHQPPDARSGVSGEHAAVSHAADL